MNPIAPVCTRLPHLPDDTMDWNYANDTALDTEVNVTCNGGLAVAGTFQKTQTVVCGLNGWNHTDVKSCTGEAMAPDGLRNVSLERTGAENWYIDPWPLVAKCCRVA